MAHTRSAEKRIRQTETRTEVNRARKSRVRSNLRAVEEAITAGDAAAAAAALKTAQPEIMRGVTKGVLHHNTAARRVSRLAKRINSLSATKA
ncbi:MAG: 30S ribosomal protein S20 [Alphaproteobacteria bacterium]|nr:30S ribosomal protein S20 [Alphaproteobacteria bacterium]